jgi:hypothetical protein
MFWGAGRWHCRFGGSGEHVLTYRGDPASSRDSADGARRLSKGVPEHIRGIREVLEMKGEQLQPGAIGRRGDWGVRCCLYKSKWSFLRRTVMESRVCLRDEVGLTCSDHPINRHCAFLPGYSEAALTIS